MPIMRKSNVIAVLVSDIHLSLKAPICRDPSVDWFETMAFYLKQLDVEAIKHNHVPIVCAGDIFDRWNCNNEVVNFALDHLPIMYAVPGQHDLPTHNYEEMHRSAYGTLVRAGRIKMIIPGAPTYWNSTKLVLWGFPWGDEVTPLVTPLEGINIAVVHEYCWQKGSSYPGAPKGNKLAGFKNKLKGYDAALFGDNHKGFLAECNGIDVLNNGGFMRRKSDEKNYQPCIGLLYDDGSIERVPLDTSIDKFVEISEAEEACDFEMESFISELESLGESGLDFIETLERYLLENKKDITTGTENEIRKAIEDA